MTQAPLITGAQLAQLAPTCPFAPALAAALDAAARAHQINTPLRLVHFLAQGGYESEGFSKFEEDLDYSVADLCRTWPGRFPTAASAEPFAGNSKALAEDVYGDRMGNSQPGDGWLYRGRGIFDLTGKDQYVAIGSLCGEPYSTNPDLVAAIPGAAASAAAFWAYRGLNLIADRDDIQTITRRINGGLNGLSDREIWLARAKRIWSVK